LGTFRVSEISVFPYFSSCHSYYYYNNNQTQPSTTTLFLPSFLVDCCCSKISNFFYDSNFLNSNKTHHLFIFNKSKEFLSFFFLNEWNFRFRDLRWDSQLTLHTKKVKNIVRHRHAKIFSTSLRGPAQTSLAHS